MNTELKSDVEMSEPATKHPPVETIEDVLTFKLNRLVAIGERAGQHWSERLFDLSLNEWRLLALVKSRQPCRAGDMADLLLMDKSQTSRIIKSLLTKQLIQNTPDPNDGRAVALRPTEKGEKLYVEVFAEVMRSNERVLATLSVEEVQAFDRTLKKLLVHSEDLLEKRLGRKIVR